LTQFVHFMRETSHLVQEIPVDAGAIARALPFARGFATEIKVGPPRIKHRSGRL
jgi:hypothetical protein